MRRPVAAVRGVVVAALLAGAFLAACAGDESTTSSTVGTTGATSTAGTSSTTTSPPTTTVATSTTTSPTTIAPTTTTTTLPAGVLERRELGRSVEGRPIVAQRRGTPGGRVVLVIGVIHGDEDAGVAIVDLLASGPVPEGVELWLVESMNPDGQAAQRRTNANLVDLNRNFPRRWAPLGQPGDWQYAGPSAASEPETQAVVAFISSVRPDLAIWYHQDLFRIAPAEGRAGELRQQYAQLTGLPVLPVTGGVYTGTAAPWGQAAVPGSVGFVVELGPQLDATQAAAHTAAVLTLAAG